MRFPARALVFGGVTAMLSACGGAGTDAGTTLATEPKVASEFVFTAIPDQDVRRLEQRFGAVADYLADALEVPVRYVPVKSYAAAVTAFVNDDVQLAWFGGLSGVQARLQVPDARAIAQGESDPNYYSVLIAHRSTGLQPLAELTDALRGKTLTFGSKGSTSGRLMPEFFFREHYGQSPQEVFSRVGYSGDHTRTIALVQAGAWDLGVLGYTTWETEKANGRVDPELVQQIWASPGYPDYQWTIRGDVDARFGDGFSGRVQQALLDIDDPDMLQRFARSRFIPARNADYAPILDTARAVGLIDPPDTATTP